jgi:hypothetical protein
MNDFIAKTEKIAADKIMPNAAFGIDHSRRELAGVRLFILFSYLFTCFYFSCCCVLLCILLFLCMLVFDL